MHIEIGRRDGKGMLSKKKKVHEVLSTIGISSWEKTEAYNFRPNHPDEHQGFPPIIEGHVAHSFGGFLTRKKLAKLLDQYFGPNDTCEEVAVGTHF